MEDTQCNPEPQCCEQPESAFQVGKVFTYQPPKEGQPAKYEAIRSNAKELAFVILENTPECADQTAAIRKLREAVMTANAAIALEGLV